MSACSRRATLRTETKKDAPLPTETWPDERYSTAPVADTMDAALSLLERLENPPSDDNDRPVPTGFRALDRLLGGGLWPGDVTGVAGRPGVGTSTIALNIAAHAAIKNQMHTLLMCSDATTEELNIRLLASRARIRIQHMRNGSMTTDDWEALADVVPTVSVAPLYLNTDPVITVEKVAEEVERRVRRDGLRLLVVDGLPSLAGSDPRGAQVHDDLRALKRLARKHDVAVVVTGKLHHRTDRSPELKPPIRDLDNGRSVQALTDQLLQLDRDDIGAQEHPQTRKAGLLAMTSDGQTRKLAIAFQPHYCRFINPQ